MIKQTNIAEHLLKRGTEATDDILESKIISAQETLRGCGWRKIHTIEERRHISPFLNPGLLGPFFVVHVQYLFTERTWFQLCFLSLRFIFLQDIH